MAIGSADSARGMHGGVRTIPIAPGVSLAFPRPDSALAATARIPPSTTLPALAYILIEA